MIDLCFMFSYNEMNLDIGSVSGIMNTVIYKNAINMLHVHVLLIFLNVSSCRFKLVNNMYIFFLI